MRIVVLLKRKNAILKVFINVCFPIVIEAMFLLLKKKKNLLQRIAKVMFKITYPYLARHAKKTSHSRHPKRERD